MNEEAGFVTVENLKADEKRNGLQQLLVDVAAAKESGVRFTPEAALYVLDAASRFGSKPRPTTGWAS